MTKGKDPKMSISQVWKDHDWKSNAIPQEVSESNCHAFGIVRFVYCFWSVLIIYQRLTLYQSHFAYSCFWLNLNYLTRKECTQYFVLRLFGFKCSGCGQAYQTIHKSFLSFHYYNYLQGWFSYELSKLFKQWQLRQSLMNVFYNNIYNNNAFKIIL